MSEGLLVGQIARIEAIAFDRNTIDGTLKTTFVSIVHRNQWEVYKSSDQTKEWKYLNSPDEFGVIGLVIAIRKHRETGKMAVRLLVGEDRWWAEWEVVHPVENCFNIAQGENDLNEI